MSDSPGGEAFYSVDGLVAVGPVTLEKIKRLALDGTLQESSLYAIPNHEDPTLARYCWQPIALLDDPVLQLPEAESLTSLASLLREYKGWLIGVNFRRCKEFDLCRLVGVGRDFLSIQPFKGDSLVHIPFAQIISVREERHTMNFEVSTAAPEPVKQHKLAQLLFGDPKGMLLSGDITVPLLIEAFHLVVYKGATSVGFSVPLG